MRSLLLYSFVRKEAVLSSQIEGTQSSLADLLLYEIDEQPGVPHGRRARGEPLRGRAGARADALARADCRCACGCCARCTRVLMSHPGGRGKTPGELRRSQVWIGGTRPGNAVFVPPPADAAGRAA